MKMKPLALGVSIAAAAASAAAYAFDLPLPKPTQSPVPSAGTMMPIPEILPVNVDTSRSIIDQALSAAGKMEYNQTGRIGVKISEAGHKTKTLDVADSSGWILENSTFKITDPCEIDPDLALCRKDIQCQDMGGTWIDGKCEFPSSGGVVWPKNARVGIYIGGEALYINTDSTGTSMVISNVEYQCSSYYHGCVHLVRKRREHDLRGKGVVFDEFHDLRGGAIIKFEITPYALKLKYMIWNGSFGVFAGVNINEYNYDWSGKLLQDMILN